MPVSNEFNRRSTSSVRLVRQWALLRLLEKRAYSVRELAEELEASKSSIQRDITMLQEHFMIVAESVGQQKRVYRLKRVRQLAPLRVSEAEMEALDAAIEASGDERLKSLHRKLCARKL